MKKEHYIPFDKEFIFDHLITSNAFDKNQAADLKKLFDISEHYFHYEAFNLNLKLKQHYAAFDPDLLKNEREGYVGKSDVRTFKENLNKVLESGNYTRIEQEILNQAFSKSDLIGLKLAIDLNDFQEYELYVRGYNKTKEKVKKFFFWKQEIELEYYDRVMIYLHYNDNAYFKRKRRKLKKLPFDPSCIVLKIFKRVPKNDLETIFPNAIPKMSRLDKLLFWVPAIFGGVSLLITKVIPELILMYKAYRAGEPFDLLHSNTGFYQGLAALGVLGAYLFRQYSDFVNKKIRFSKLLSDSLYFKNLGNNSGAFYSLINSSEEEEHKEFMLAYTFLNKSQTPLTADELDLNIENWFKTVLNSALDFDVEDSLIKLKNIGLCNETDGKWEVVPLAEALIRIDEIWDGIFDYNK